jgi:hypothetical protein
MTRLAIALALFCLTACPGPAKPTTTGSGSGEPMLAKKLSLSWGISQQGEMADLFLQVTDETGKQVSHELGRWKGTCAADKAQDNMKALIALSCRTGGTGTQLQAIRQGGDEIVIVKLGIDEGVMPDPMSREEVKRIKVPLGVAIEAGS